MEWENSGEASEEAVTVTSFTPPYTPPTSSSASMTIKEPVGFTPPGAPKGANEWSDDDKLMAAMQAAVSDLSGMGKNSLFLSSCFIARSHFPSSYLPSLLSCFVNKRSDHLNDL